MVGEVAPLHSRSVPSCALGGFADYVINGQLSCVSMEGTTGADASDRRRVPIHGSRMAVEPSFFRTDDVIPLGEKRGGSRNALHDRFDDPQAHPLASWKRL